MRLFATVTLLVLSLFWSYPFLAPGIEKAVRDRVKPAPRGEEPVLVLAPTKIHAPGDTTASVSLTRSFEDPRQ